MNDLAPGTPWALPAPEVLEALEVDPAQGLHRREAGKRRGRYGPNRLRSAKKTSAWTILAQQLESLLMLLLAVAAALSILPGLNTLLETRDPGLEGWAIVLVASLLPWAAGQIYRSRAAPGD